MCLKYVGKDSNSVTTTTTTKTYILFRTGEMPQWGKVLVVQA